MIAVDPTSPEHGRLCPRTSDLDFLGDLNGIVNLDAKISNRALDLRVAHRTQVAGSPIDQCFGSAQGVRAELERIEADTGDPLADKAGVLTCREAMSVAAATCKQELSPLPASLPEILVDGLPRLLGQLEPDRATGLLLADCCSIERVAIGGHIVDADCHDIAASQFAVDGEIK